MIAESTKPLCRIIAVLLEYYFDRNMQSKDESDARILDVEDGRTTIMVNVQRNFNTHGVEKVIVVLNDSDNPTHKTKIFYKVKKSIKNNRPTFLAIQCRHMMKKEIIDSIMENFYQAVLPDISLLVLSGVQPVVVWKQ